MGKDETLNRDKCGAVFKAKTVGALDFDATYRFCHDNNRVVRRTSAGDLDGGVANIDSILYNDSSAGNRTCDAGDQI
jgi:hypothetical protein